MYHPEHWYSQNCAAQAAESPQIGKRRVFHVGVIDYLQRWTPKKVTAHRLK